MKKFRVSALTVFVAAAALAIAGCGSSSSSDSSTSSQTNLTGVTESGSGAPLIIGSNTFDESVLLMDIWAEALTAKGIAVETKPKVGDRPVYIPALKDGSIDMVPEYTGALLYFLDAAATATTSADVEAALPAALGTDLKIFEPSSAEDKDSINVTQETAAEFNLKSIGDLKDHAGDMILGGAANFETRTDGVPAIEQKYGVVFGEFKGADIKVIIDDLKNDRIDAANLYTTDPAITANNFVTLEDPEAFTAAQNLVPLIKADKSTPEIEEALNAVSAKLTTEVLIDLNTQVAAGTDSAEVAKTWLTDQGLV